MPAGSPVSGTRVWSDPNSGGTTDFSVRPELRRQFRAFFILTELKIHHTKENRHEKHGKNHGRNYVNNALNHVDGEKVIEIKITQENDMAKITVFNTGTPIPEEDLPHIWEKFYKVDKARTREYGGNGIGLSIVKAIMDSFGKGYGAINHTNGVEFWFELDMK